MHLLSFKIEFIGCLAYEVDIFLHPNFIFNYEEKTTEKDKQAA